jgi:hypothetical protein
MNNFPKDATGRTVKIGDKIKGEGYLECHDGFKVDRTPVVTVRMSDNGVLMFGWLSARSFPKFWIVN